jgi:uncharacterized protein
MSLLRSRGRGKDYSLTRGLIETTLRAAYVGDWPARAWSRVTTSVRRVDVSLPSPSSLRIGFVSDLHLGPTTPLATLENAFAILRDARLDVLALGGDYVFLDATRKKAELLARLISTVPARLKVAVLGNHDLWTEHALIEDALRGVGVRVLINESVDIDDVSIVGVDDPWTGTLDADAALRHAHKPTKIAIAHAPEALPSLAGRVDAMICGHTHGGHIALPGGRPIVMAGKLGRRHPHGVHDVNGTRLIVSRGVGGIELPIRTYAQPDVVLLTLGPER